MLKLVSMAQNGSFLKRNQFCVERGGFIIREIDCKFTDRVYFTEPMWNP